MYQRQFSIAPSAAFPSSDLLVFTYSDLEDKLLAVVGGLKGVENGRQLLTLELDCNCASVWVFWRRRGRVDIGAAAVALVSGVVGKRFSHTVDDGTNDLVNSAIGVGGGAGEALAQGGSE